MAKDHYKYRGWLVSDRFLKRAFAVYGYSLVAGLIVIVPVYLVALLIALLFYAVS